MLKAGAEDLVPRQHEGGRSAAKSHHSCVYSIFPLWGVASGCLRLMCIVWVGLQYADDLQKSKYTAQELVHNIGSPVLHHYPRKLVVM
jgi:hypothetical protein